MRRFAPLAAAVLAANAGLATAQVYTFVALPDTQFYSDSATRFPQFLQQTNWIKDNRAAYNISFVSHLGDIVQNGSVLTEWTRADQAMDVLDTIVPELPYSAVPGNHDYATTGSKGTLAVNYVNNFGPARYAGKTWYRGGTGNGWNHYQIVTLGGREYLHLALEWLPATLVAGQDNAITWAQSILDLHPNLPAIISTHEHIIDDFSIPSGRSAGGEATWQQLIRQNNQVFLTLNGHFHRGPDGDDGERYEVGINTAGNQVHQFLSDYQAYPNGGDAWLRLYIFNEPANTIHVVTYSPKGNATNTAGAGLSRFHLASPSNPYLMPAGLPALTAGTVQIDANSRFDIPVNFSTRFIPLPPPPPPPPSPFVTFTFREGVSGYTGTQDTYLAFATPTTNFGAATIIKSDTVDGTPSGQVHGLLRFDNIFGAGPGQLDPAATIDTATLILNTTNGTVNANNLHRMLVNWNEAATWNSLTSGIQANNVEARSAVDASATPGTGTTTIDVTTSLQAWATGAANLGWAILPTGSDGWDFSSSEATTAASRPQLAVRILAPGVQARIFQNGLNGYTGTQDTELAQSTPTTPRGAATSFSIDSDDPNGTGSDNHVLIRFDDIIGPGANQVPADPSLVINRAVLVIEGFDAGDGASVHRVLLPWDESATWANSFGGNGIQPNDVEALVLEDTFVAGATGRVEIDVTAAIQAWLSNPAANLGWALLPIGGNGWDIRSSEGSFAPQLRVYFTPPTSASCPADLADTDGVPNPDGAVDNGDFTAFFSAFFLDQSDPARLTADIADTDGATTLQGAGPDGNVDNGDFTAFFLYFFEGCP